MSETVERVDLAATLTALHDLVDVLQTAALTDYGDDDVVTATREFERLRRRLETVDHTLILAVEARGLPGHLLTRGAAPWLRQVLNIDIHEANARVRAAHAAGPRRSLLGEPLPPAHPVVAAAQATGALGVKQARVITSMLDKLPDAACEEIPAVEARLVGFAANLDATQLMQCAERERAHLDPDGGYRDVERRRRERDFRFTQRPDGSCTGSFAGTAELGELLQVTFDSLAAPHPESNGIKDPRTPGQRRHDAVLDALKAAVAARSLATAGGVLATVILTMTAEDYLTGTGFATTGHGAQVPVREAMDWAGGDYRLFATVLDSVKGIVAYSHCQRLFTEGQRLTFIARDGGCAFPSCTAPPGWCQAAHILDYIDGGPTSVDNGFLACGFHHREYVRQGWTVRLGDNGRPEWIPPRWIDPDREPIRS